MSMTEPNCMPICSVPEVTSPTGDDGVLVCHEGSLGQVPASYFSGGGGGPDGGLLGAMQMYAGAADPNTNWMIADGRALDRTTYADLFAVVGTLYGNGDGSTTFNIPDMRGRTPTGRDTGDSDFDQLGETGGSKTHALTGNQMPSHTHPMGHNHSINHNHTINHNHPATTSASGGSHNHSIQRTSTGETSHKHDGGGNVANAPLEGQVANPVAGTTLSAGAHTHSVDLPNYTGNSGSHSGNSGSFSGNTGTRGGSPVEAFPVVQPYAVVNFIIRVIV